MSGFLTIDGSQGEGGGQILRSSLSLSILTGRPFRIEKIRANRDKPGLAPQHLMCVKAAAEICGGTYKGGSVGSMSLYFEPGPVTSGDFHFRIGTAGATSLVLHTVYLPLLLRGTGPSTITISGGTHVPHSPCYHFLETTWAGYMQRLGAPITLSMTRPGFYPRGGGEIVAAITPVARLKSLTLMDRLPLSTAGGFAAVADLPVGVSLRLARRLTHRLHSVNLECHIPEERWSNGPSCVVAAIFRQAPVPTLFFAIGEKGKPSEAVADDCAEEALSYFHSTAPVDPHSADQIVLPLAFAGGASAFRVCEVTEHLTTNIAIIRQFEERSIKVVGDHVELP